MPTSVSRESSLGFGMGHDGCGVFAEGVAVGAGRRVLVVRCGGVSGDGGIGGERVLRLTPTAALLTKAERLTPTTALLTKAERTWQE